MRTALVIAIALVAGCTTRYVEFSGACITQQWMLTSFVLRTREICELPAPEEDEESLGDKDAISPYPDFFDRRNKADTAAPDLLESQRFDKTLDEAEEEEEEEEAVKEAEAAEQE